MVFLKRDCHFVRPLAFIAKITVVGIIGSDIVELNCNTSVVIASNITTAGCKPFATTS